jgi:hypothetical protein
MKRFCLLLTFLGPLTLEAHAVSVIDRGGEAYISAAALERDAAIAIKNLPGQKQVVACSAERCALVKGFVNDGGDLLVQVDSLARALGAKARFDEGRQNVSFEFLPDVAAPAGRVPRVGQLAPDFRLTKLDGSSVALSDFRGRRVLINSWASW